MAITPSKMIPLGTPAPNFSLMDTSSNETVNLAACKPEQALVIMFICNHCPFVKHIRQGILDLAHDYQTKGIKFVAISSNDAESYPDDAPEQMKRVAEQYNYPFPYLYDETQEVAKAYQATCTPDFFVFDRDLRCVYRGRFDAATPGNEEIVTGNELRAALDDVLAGKSVNQDQKPSIGCNIKWK